MTRAAVALLLLVGAAVAQGPLRPVRPNGTTNWVTDAADVIDPADRARINKLAKALLRDKQIPIVVLTVPALDGQTVETYSTALFNAWGIGSETHNYGMLLVVAMGDRRARIELGAGWGRIGDLDARKIMDTLIVPRFKEGEFSAGILEGVRGLDAMGRGESIPSPARPGWWWPLWVVVGLCAAGAVASVMISGDRGWGALVLHALAAVVFAILFSRLTGDGGGSGSGGSFGGGFSGGGGASGSW